MTKHKLTDAEQVANYMALLEHPLKHEVEILREIIKENTVLNERIKWNAPSYFTHEDLLTFNLHNKNRILLVFHHPEIINISSPILEGEYKDRRLVIFDSLEKINQNTNELKRIIRDLVEKTIV